MKSVVLDTENQPITMDCKCNVDKGPVIMYDRGG